jgi:hypothetical protein
MIHRLELSRSQILCFRRAGGSLDERLPAGAKSLRKVAWAGLQDSVLRAALLSIHARVEGTSPTTWEHPSLIQLWGPRFNDYVVASKDLAVFSLGRLPADAGRRGRAHDTADRLHAFLECPSARQVMGWARSRTASDTPLRLVESSCAGTARTSLSSGRRLRRTWIRSTRVSNSRAGTSTSLVRLRPRLSPAGPEFGLRRRAPFSRNSSVRLCRCGRRSATDGSLSRTRQRSGPTPDLLR